MQMVLITPGVGNRNAGTIGVTWTDDGTGALVVSCRTLFTEGNPTEHRENSVLTEVNPIHYGDKKPCGSSSPWHLHMCGKVRKGGKLGRSLIQCGRPFMIDKTHGLIVCIAERLNIKVIGAVKLFAPGGAGNVAVKETGYSRRWGWGETEVGTENRWCKENGLNEQQRG